MLTKTLKRKIHYLLLNHGIKITRVGRRGEEVFPEYIDPFFVQIYKKNVSKTMAPWQGLYSAYQAAKYISLNRLAGDVVECGVWKGGCAIIMAETLQQFGDTSRNIYLYDTFTGMSEPTEVDTKGGGIISAVEKFKQLRKDEYVDWCYSPYEEVQKNVELCPYPSNKFVLVQGKIEDTIPNTMPEKIALLRLDTDWYESTKHGLEYLYPLIVRNGVFIADDFGAWAGARKAIQEYFDDKPQKILLHLDYYYGAVTGIKSHE